LKKYDVIKFEISDLLNFLCLMQNKSTIIEIIKAIFIKSHDNDLY